jgi:hypothetical protein
MEESPCVFGFLTIDLIDEILLFLALGTTFFTLSEHHV